MVIAFKKLIRLKYRLPILKMLREKNRVSKSNLKTMFEENKFWISKITLELKNDEKLCPGTHTYSPQVRGCFNRVTIKNTI